MTSSSAEGKWPLNVLAYCTLLGLGYTVEMSPLDIVGSNKANPHPIGDKALLVLEVEGMPENVLRPPLHRNCHLSPGLRHGAACGSGCSGRQRFGLLPARVGGSARWHPVAAAGPRSLCSAESRRPRQLLQRPFEHGGNTLKVRDLCLRKP